MDLSLHKIKLDLFNVSDRIKKIKNTLKLHHSIQVDQGLRYLKDKNSFDREDQFFNVHKARLVCLHIHATHTKINLLNQ